jgi:hemerythrin superfamily protein
MKEIQELSALQEVKLDTTRITITNPDDNEYVLVYKNPKNIEKTIASSRIKGKATASQFKKAIEKFYKDTLKSNINVYRHF